MGINVQSVMYLIVSHVCSSINQCGICNKRYQLANVYLNGSVNSVCVTCQVPNCIMCSNNNQCQICSQGYTVLFNVFIHVKLVIQMVLVLDV